MADVFISYKSERRNAAQHLAKILEFNGFSVWFDYHLTTGRDFGKQIQNELLAAKAVVVLWCESSVDADWVLEEAEIAKHLDKLVPVRIQDVGLPVGFSRLDTLNLAGWSGDPTSGSLYALIEELRRFGAPQTTDGSGLARYREEWLAAGGDRLHEYPLTTPVEKGVERKPLNTHAAISPVVLGGTALALVAAGIIGFTALNYQTVERALGLSGPVVDVSLFASEDALHTARDALAGSGLQDYEQSGYRSFLREETDTLIIEPDYPYLGAVRDGGPIWPLRYTWSPWEYALELPTLDIKILNSSQSTVFVSEVVFKVRASSPDLRPVPVIDGIGYRMSLPLGNVGWGDMEDMTFSFVLLPDAAGLEEAYNQFRAADERHLYETARFAKDYWGLDLSEYFKHDGLDLARYQTMKHWVNGSISSTDGRVVCLSEDADPPGIIYDQEEDSWCQRQLPQDEYDALVQETLGPFQNGYAIVAGDLSYSQLERDGEVVRHTVGLVGPVRIGEPGVGAPAPPSHRYNVALRVDDSDYEIRVPVSHVLAPNEADRFTIAISADRSSYHDFWIELVYDGSVISSSRPIDLEFFISRLDREFVSQGETAFNDIGKTAID